MKVQVIGCNHHTTDIEFRERLAFQPNQVPDALDRFQRMHPGTEAVLLSTCNRVELYTASEKSAVCPSHEEVVDFFAAYHGLNATDIASELRQLSGEEAIRHLFTTAASLDSMVVGEAQILSQVKQAYEMANDGDFTGPLTHASFQAALRVAKRIATETALHKRRISIPSVAVADFASQFFERFDNKTILVIGAGEMGEETLQYLIDLNATDIHIVNRSIERAEDLASRTAGEAQPWEMLDPLLIKADLVVSTTGANKPIVTIDHYKDISQKRFQRPLFVLDLAVPRDFEPSIGDELGVYLYSIDDLQAVCDKNQRARQRELPKAQEIVEAETAKFMAELNHRTTVPWVKQLREQADSIKQDELARLLNKLEVLGELGKQGRKELEVSFDRLVNKLLHPPLESLRDDASKGLEHGLLDALKKLFQLRE
jgi:glutamyl-tRNA reductase|tara:strand:- start:137 stop:1420 length:1284 start_codon:yes stop_codon:yes gene_type:complete